MKAPKNNVCRAASFELRTDSEGDGFTLEGYGAVFESPTRIDSWEGKFDEVIARGAFSKTIKERRPVLQFDHGRDAATGSVPIGAIEEIREDDRGLFVRARLHDNARVEPIRQAIASGAIDGMSFRFRVTREEWNEEPDVPVRTIREVELFEVGPVVFPAYAATTVGVRTLIADLEDEERQRLIEDLAREIFKGDFGARLINQQTTPPDQGTSSAPPDAAPQGTSGATPGERSAFLRSIHLRDLEVTS